MKNRTCRRRGAKEFNFKNQSAATVISNTKFHKEVNHDHDHEFGGKNMKKKEIQNYSSEESDQE